MRILCAAERRLAPARPCLHCGEPFQPNMKSVWSGKGKCCSPRCRSLYASAASRDGFFGGTDDKRSRNRAEGLIHMRQKRGVVVKPADCSTCGKPSRRIQAHHPDYAKPHEIVWLCARCHAKAHRVPGFLEGVAIVNTGTVRKGRVVA